MWDQYVLYADRSWKDEQRLVTLFLRKRKSINVEGGLKLKAVLNFIEKTDEPLHLRK
jgi:hypothetical protein